jgi:hypothetical protein
MKYWQVHGKVYHKFIPMMTWAIEYEDGTYLTISIRNHDGEPKKRAWVSRSTTFPIDNRKGKTELLKEVPKENVMEALKKAMEILDLPQEINIFKHKFNYAEE